MGDVGFIPEWATCERWMAWNVRTTLTLKTWQDSGEVQLARMAKAPF